MYLKTVSLYLLVAVQPVFGVSGPAAHPVPAPAAWLRSALHSDKLYLGHTVPQASAAAAPCPSVPPPGPGPGMTRHRLHSPTRARADTPGV